MKNAKVRKSRDSMSMQCAQCGKEQLIAYWDYELEHYIYLSESTEGLCNLCETTHCQTNNHQFSSEKKPSPQSFIKKSEMTSDSSFAVALESK